MGARAVREVLTTAGAPPRPSARFAPTVVKLSAVGQSTADPAKYMSEWRERKRALLATGAVTVVHGTANAYVNYGCRCDECKAGARKRKGRHPIAS